MTPGKRIYWVMALVALMALAGAAVTVTSRVTSASGPTPAAAVQNCDQQDEADDATEAAQGGADTDNVEDQCGDQNEAADAAEVEGGDAQAQSGTLDDGKDLLPQARITVEQAVAAAQAIASGSAGEVDLERAKGRLVFNVDVGDKDVKVDAGDGSIVAVDAED